LLQWHIISRRANEEGPAKPFIYSKNFYGMEETISTTLLKKGKKYSFYSDKVRLPSGRITERDIVRHPGGVVIVAVHEQKIVLIRQYRYALNQYLFEIPAGTLELNESPLECAVRELREEIGYVASRWTSLFQCYMVPGYSDELLHFYLAEGLSKVGASPEDGEDIEALLMDFDKVAEMVRKNEIIDGKTMLAVIWYLTHAGH